METQLPNIDNDYLITRLYGGSLGKFDMETRGGKSWDIKHVQVERSGTFLSISYCLLLHFIWYDKNEKEEGEKGRRRGEEKRVRQMLLIRHVLFN